MDLRINCSSGVPIYLQLMEQIKHAIDTGAIRAGEQLPTIRKIAGELAMNPNTAARAFLSPLTAFRRVTVANRPCAAWISRCHAVPFAAFWAATAPERQPR
jgi:DNA-binding transcriptional MocR family regulator